jgi:3-isopropylmalate dehydratase small subunit
VIAPSSARIFRGNTFANGMLCVDLPVESVDFLLQEQDPHISVDWEHGLVTTGCGREFQFKLTDHERNLVQSGGLVPVMIKMAAELQKADKL